MLQTLRPTLKSITAKYTLEETTLADNADTAVDPAPTPIVEAFPTLEAEPATVNLSPSIPQQTIEELMEDAEIFLTEFQIRHS